ncbi:MAG: PEP-CTERM system histidine kinase PrsK [Betaproteobacteria bacterium]|nr:PEP-CTERM system histidine kinase PrsK [Betaproteobacteria bacterium]
MPTPMAQVVALASYGTAACAFGLLTLLFIGSWQGRAAGAMLALAAGISTAWAAAGTLSIAAVDGPSVAFDALEIARSGAWFAFLLQVIRQLRRANGRSDRLLSFLSLGLAGALGFLLVATVFPRALPALLSPGPFLRDIVARVLLAVTGLVLVEQVFRNTRMTQRWSIKHLTLALGGLFSYDFFVYSQAMLFHRMDPGSWAARGFINALVVPLIAVSAVRNAQWSLDVHVSRGFVFHTASLVGAGGYLLLMAAAGYYLRAFGGSWGAVLEAVFLFAAVTVLLLMLFSGTLRARLKILLSQHFFSYKYDYRREWLRFTQFLSVVREGARPWERVIEAVATLVESPGGALWLDAAGAFERLGHWNMPLPACAVPADGSLMRSLAARQWVVNLDEYRRFPEMYGELQIPAEILARADCWLIVPLLLGERLLGFIVLMQPRGKMTFNWEVHDLLKTAARQAASFVAQLQAGEQLAVSRQFDSFHRMSAFLVHDLKNLVAQLALVLSNAPKHRNNPEFQDDMISTVENAVAKMNALLSQLRGTRAEPAARGAVDLRGLVEEVVAAKAHLRPQPALECAAVVPTVVAERGRLARVLGHVVQNACEATPAGGSVRVRLDAQGRQAIVEVIDTGKGMSAGFVRERLFRPFDSTKDSGMGIGAHECREYVRELGGQVEVRSEEGRGTLFRVSLPAMAAAEVLEGALP